METQQEERWQMVEFPKRRNQQKWNSEQNQKDESGINVKLFHAKIGKYLDSQTFRYRKSNHQADPQQGEQSGAPSPATLDILESSTTPMEGRRKGVMTDVNHRDVINIEKFLNSSSSNRAL